MGDAMSAITGTTVHAGEVLLTLDRLHKRYPNGVEAVRSISMEVRRGEVFGLVGPNGAGKSTLLKLIAGLLRPEQGTVLMEGVDVTGRPVEAARRIGLMPDPLGVYTDVSCREYLVFFALASVQACGGSARVVALVGCGGGVPFCRVAAPAGTGAYAAAGCSAALAR